mmetsp:Transcript_16467/g.39416  ORF Transcript_16467/g.39416 Transcript_16467/m.39416 type:complete len:293 (+) Transcript_16467:120-998(+)
MSGLYLLLQAAAAKCNDDSSASASSIGSVPTCSTERHEHNILHSNFTSAVDKQRNLPKTISYLSYSNGSLPPKKRIRLASFGDASFPLRISKTSISTLDTSALSGSGYIATTESSSPTRNSEWTAADMLRGRALIAPSSGNGPSKKSKNNEAATTCGAGGGTSIICSLKRSKREHRLTDASAVGGNNSATTAGKRRKNSSLVKDLDGNDMCMGYFSTIMASHLKSSSADVEERDDTSSSAKEPAALPPSTEGADKVMMMTAAGGNFERNSGCIDAKSKLYESYLRALTIVGQ